MHENQNDLLFDNTDKGQNEEESRWGETSSQAQTQSSRIEDENSDISIEEDEAGINVAKSAERHPMIMEEYERSRLQAIPKNNNFLSIIEEDEDDEENDLDADEEDLDESGLEEEDLDDLDDDNLEDAEFDEEDDIPRDFTDELLSETPHPRIVEGFQSNKPRDFSDDRSF